MGSFRRLLPLLSLAVCLLGCSQAFAAEKRVALIIGNSAYKNVARLANPANDAALVAAMFKAAGFVSVIKKTDLGAAEMRKALREFGNTARDADVAVVYYAGHGIELDGNNYLIPTDATLETDSDVLDETLAIDRIQFAIEPAKQLRLIILDACRDNPFAKTMKRTMASRAIGRGLAKVEPSTPNTLIAFSAKAGFTSSDGDGSNSPFAAALVQHLATPGLDLRKAFGFVRDDVLKATNNVQEPFIYGSLGGNDVALVRAPSAEPPRELALDPGAPIRRDYELAAQIGTKEAWDYFIANYPDSFYAKLAIAQRNKLAANDAKTAAGPAAAVEQKDDAQRVASLPPSSDKSAPSAVIDTPRLLQLELRRVGCNTGAVDGNWNAAAQRALDLFNRHAGMKLDVKVASVDALDAVKSKTERICPLICDHGFKADGDRCTRVTCRDGYTVGEDNTCEKIQEKKPARKHEEATRREREEPARRVRSAPANDEPAPKPQASGQIICSSQGGCRPVQHGCRLVQNTGAVPNGPAPGANGTLGVHEVCN